MKPAVNRQPGFRWGTRRAARFLKELNETDSANNEKKNIKHTQTSERTNESRTIGRKNAQKNNRIFFLNSVNLFAVGCPKRFRRMKKLSKALCLASGYAFAPENSVPKQNHTAAKINKIHRKSKIMKSLGNNSS